MTSAVLKRHHLILSGSLKFSGLDFFPTLVGFAGNPTIKDAC
jgi:hypothetical protein